MATSPTLFFLVSQNRPTFCVFNLGYLACAATTINLYAVLPFSALKITNLPDVVEFSVPDSRTKTGRDVSLLAKLSLFYLSLGSNKSGWIFGGSIGKHPWKLRAYEPRNCKLTVAGKKSPILLDDFHTIKMFGLFPCSFFCRCSRWSKLGNTWIKRLTKPALQQSICLDRLEGQNVTWINQVLDPRFELKLHEKNVYRTRSTKTFGSTQMFTSTTRIQPIIPSLRGQLFFYTIWNISFNAIPLSQGVPPHVRTCYCVIAMLVNWDPKFWYTTGNLISDIASLMTFLGIHGKLGMVRKCCRCNLGLCGFAKILFDWNVWVKQVSNEESLVV